VLSKTLTIKDIHVYYGKSRVLQGMSMEVKKGEIITLLGRNGAGKTTTLRTIMGLNKPRAGKILFKDVDITTMPSFEIARLGMGYVPQGRRLFSQLTVLENLKTGFRGQPDKDVLMEIFELFPVLRERLNQISGTLSGGEQQMLAVARALVPSPCLLLMDEPTTSLMPILVSKLKEVTKNLNEKGMTILLVEQRVPLALSLCDRVYIMEKGQIRYSGKPEELLKREDILLQYLGVVADSKY